MPITGYRIGTSDFKEAMHELGKCRAQARRLSEKEYRRMLSEKAAFLCDCVALGMCERPSGHAIMDDARAQLNDEIAIAMRSGACVPQNLQCCAYISPYEDATYVRVICPNEKLLVAFKGLEPYSLTDEEAQDPGNGKAAAWRAVYSLEKSCGSAVIDMTYVPETGADALTFPEINGRAQKMARHSLLNRYMNLLSGGRQIPPVYMMEYVDRAMGMLLAEGGQKELKAAAMQLAQTLPDINKNPDIVLKPYGEPQPDAHGRPDEVRQEDGAPERAEGERR